MPNSSACENRFRTDSRFYDAHVEPPVEAVDDTRHLLLCFRARPSASGPVHCYLEVQKRGVSSQWEAKGLATPFIRHCDEHWRQGSVCQSLLEGLPLTVPSGEGSE
jgi:hypothetical protein